MNLEDLSQVEDIQRQIDAEILRRSYYDFFIYFWQRIEAHPLQEAPHIKYLCDECEQIMKWASDWKLQDSAEHTYNLLVNVAPGTTKSSIFSKYSTPFLWLLNPDVAVGNSSYSSTSVSKFTHIIKKIMNSKEYLAYYPNLELEIDNMGEQRNQYKGRRVATSTGGSITGDHLDLVVIDDPDKPPLIKLDKRGRPRLEAGATLTEMLSGRVWFDSTLSSRLTSELYSRFMVTQQRLSRLDFSAHIIDKAELGAMDLKHINLPAQKSRKNPPFSRLYVDGKIIEEKDLSHLYTGNILDPHRHGKKSLERREKILGSYYFAAQYIQAPRKEHGGIIKSSFFEIVNKSDLPTNLVKHFYTDPSEGKENSDNMASICWSLYGGCIIVWEVLAEITPFHEFIGSRDSTGQYRKKKYDLFVERNGGNWQSFHFFEAKSSGSAYIDYINDNTEYRAIGDNPQGSKMDRVNISLATLESGRVKLIKGHWNDAFLGEVSNFSGLEGDPDDQVDVLTGAIKMTDLGADDMLIEEQNSEAEIRW